jgi:hypothetical protein
LKEAIFLRNTEKDTFLSFILGLKLTNLGNVIRIPELLMVREENKIGAFRNYYKKAYEFVRVFIIEFKKLLFIL